MRRAPTARARREGADDDRSIRFLFDLHQRHQRETDADIFEAIEQAAPASR
ncbi:hypothetical protein ACFWMQ_14715 [Streptomyces sp. NPDC058372]|uniref:hypothetical protein n=1 Tax=Streptomyces sp. NPDC058372 TaxID=3346464 RepID=UPI0036560772